MFSNVQVEIEALPDKEDVVLVPISKSYLKIITIRKLTIYACFYSIVVAGRFIVEDHSFQMVYWYIVVILTVAFIVDFVMALLSFKTRKYALREQDIIYAEGLLIHAVTTVPISRIQHIETSRSWLARKFNLATLKIFTAGESGTDLSIKGLPIEEAKHINDFLSARVNGND